jgi:predicted TIM-barrel fold metal-dependent hydrolase
VRSRRDVLAVLAGGVLGGGIRGFAAAAAQTPSTVNFDVPSGACDCHVHIFGDPQRFPFTPARTYTPGTASVAELLALHRALHIDRVVVVHPSVYGTDNSCMLDALTQLGRRARGIAVIDDKIADTTLRDMKAAGVRGIRINLGTAGVTDPTVVRERFRAAVGRAEKLDWHIQVFTQPSVIQALREDVLASRVPVVFDHFGGARGALGVDQPGFDVLLELVHLGKAYVKISAPYRGSKHGPDFPDMAPLAKALFAANPQRVLWGTDWPHPDTAAAPGRKPADVSPFLPIDDGRLLTQLAVWAPDASLRKKILVDNPARLYGF